MADGKFRVKTLPMSPANPNEIIENRLRQISRQDRSEISDSFRDRQMQTSWREATEGNSVTPAKTNARFADAAKIANPRRKPICLFLDTGRNANIKQHKGRVDVARQATECKNDPKPAISRLRAGPTHYTPGRSKRHARPQNEDHARVTGQPLQGSTSWHISLSPGNSRFP